jgi:hypothetical protein
MGSLLVTRVPPPLAPPPQEEGNNVIYRKTELPSSCGGRVGDGGMSEEVARNILKTPIFRLR